MSQRDEEQSRGDFEKVDRSLNEEGDRLHVLHATRERRRQWRGPKATVDPWQPVAVLVEPEVSRDRKWEEVLTLFLANRECPFHCAMCDLWKHTLDEPTPVGAIPAQIQKAQATNRSAPHIKLYNSGNFFDPLAIPPSDYPEIVRLTESYQTIIVENHPRLVESRCRSFAEACEGRLEVALGLETVHPEVLESLDKQLTVEIFDQAVERLLSWGASVRAFVILQLPGLRGNEAVEWAARSIEYAFARGVDCCSLIPARVGNGWMDRLQAEGKFEPPTLAQLVQVIESLESSNHSPKPRLQVDLWDIEKLHAGNIERSSALERLERCNRQQVWGE